MWMRNSKKNKVDGLKWVRIIGFLYNDYLGFCLDRGSSTSSIVGLLTFLRDRDYLNISKIAKDYKV